MSKKRKRPAKRNPKHVSPSRKRWLAEHGPKFHMSEVKVMSDQELAELDKLPTPKNIFSAMWTIEQSPTARAILRKPS